MVNLSNTIFEWLMKRGKVMTVTIKYWKRTKYGIKIVYHFKIIFSCLYHLKNNVDNQKHLILITWYLFNINWCQSLILIFCINYAPYTNIHNIYKNIISSTYKNIIKISKIIYSIIYSNQKAHLFTQSHFVYIRI